MRRLAWVWVLLVALVAPAWAHWADLAVAEIGVEGRDVQVTLTAPTGLLGRVDDDHDGQVSTAELEAHRAELMDLLTRTVKVEGATLSSVEVLDTPSSTAAAAPSTSHSTLLLRFRAASPLDVLHVHYDLMAPDAPEARCMVTLSMNGAFDTFTFTQAQRDLRHGAPTAEARPPSTLQQLISSGPTTGRVLAVALGVAFVLGALHGLSPGHGKTIVASYLVGSRGTVGQALLLGFVVTFTHTISVIVLGVLCLTVFQYGVPPAVLPWMGAASGLLVTGMGTWLLTSALREGRSAQRRHARVVSTHDGGGARARRMGGRLVAALPRGAGVRVPHAHAHGHAHGHGHGHAGDHEHTHGHDHDHEHAHVHGPGHVHSHGGRPHSHAMPDRITLWSLILLGISGGLVPCPDALVVLLSAIAINKVLLGLMVILAFSCGLAAVLMAIGVVMVVAGKALDRHYPQRIFLRRLSLVSYAVIIVLGLGIAVHALTSGGIVRVPWA